MSTSVAERPVKTLDPLEEIESGQYQYPGIPTTCDGAEAVVHVEVHVCQAAGAYPITSSTTMGGGFNASEGIPGNAIGARHSGCRATPFARFSRCEQR